LGLLVFAIRIERYSVGAAESGAVLAAAIVIVIFFPASGRFWAESRQFLSGRYARAICSCERCYEEAGSEYGAAALGSRAG
jgi:hypothetical protein